MVNLDFLWQTFPYGNICIDKSPKISNGVNLTPAYDILCSSVYDCDQRIAKKIGKAKFYKDVTAKDWEIFAQDIDISPKIVKSELERQKGIVLDVLKEVLSEGECEIGNKIFAYVQNNL